LAIGKVIKKHLYFQKFYKIKC